MAELVTDHRVGIAKITLSSMLFIGYNNRITRHVDKRYHVRHWLYQQRYNYKILFDLKIVEREMQMREK